MSSHTRELPSVSGKGPRAETVDAFFSYSIVVSLDGWLEPASHCVDKDMTFNVWVYKQPVFVLLAS